MFYARLHIARTIVTVAARDRVMPAPYWGPIAHAKQTLQRPRSQNLWLRTYRYNALHLIAMQRHAVEPIRLA